MTVNTGCLGWLDHVDLKPVRKDGGSTLALGASGNLTVIPTLQ